MIFLDDIFPFECTPSPFVDKDDDHVSQYIIDNSKVRRRFSKGPKYPETRTAD